MGCLLSRMERRYRWDEPLRAGTPAAWENIKTEAKMQNIPLHSAENIFIYSKMSQSMAAEQAGLSCSAVK